MDSLREDLPAAVHTALRKWHAGQQDDLPWAGMLTITARLAESPVPNLDLAVKELLLEALDALDQQAGGDGAQILRLRFLDGHTATGTANRLNLSTDVVYKNQRSAIADLAQLIWQAEVEACSARKTRIVSRLDIKDPPLLFGVSDKLAELRTALTRRGGPWMVVSNLKSGPATGPQTAHLPGRPGLESTSRWGRLVSESRRSPIYLTPATTCSGG